MKLLGFCVFVFVLFLSFDCSSSTSSVGVSTNYPDNATTVPVDVVTVHSSVIRWKNTDKSVKNMVSKLVKFALPQLLRAAEGMNITTSCSKGMMKFLTGLRGMKVWAFRMFDASGKLPNGILNGNVNSLGDYDQCLSVKVPGHFNGQYCLVETSPPLPERRRFTSTENEIPEFVNITSPDSVIEEFLRRAAHYYHINFRSSACVPSTCTREDIYIIFSKVMEMQGIEFDVFVPHCEVKQEKIIFSTSEIVIMCVFGILIFLGITATLTDLFLKFTSHETSYQENQSFGVKCLLCFSFYTNTLRLLKKDTSPDSIKIFHGMKVITILWVMVNHTYYYLNFQSCTALLKARNTGKEIAFQLIANGFLNVETFFFISAVLVAYGTMKSKERKFNVFLYIFRRFWRLTPPFMLVVSAVFLVQYIGSGPVWKETVVDQLTERCKAKWWSNLLYINNFIPSAEMCLQWTWYIPVDTHLYLVSLIVLIPLKKNPRLAFMMNGLFLVAGTIITAANHLYYGLHPTAVYAFSHPDDSNYFIDRGYFRTYVHCSTYCVGLTVGYILATKQKIRIPLALNLLGWVVAFVSALTVLYGVYEWNQGNVPGIIVSTMYACTSKFVWSLALAWVTVTCMTGNGGIATSILSWEAFVPFARLTYMTYLIHPIIHMVYTGSTRTLIQTDHRALLYYYLGDVVLSFICAYPLSLLFESPFMCLEKVFFSRGRPAKIEEKSSNQEKTDAIDNISEKKKSNIVEENGVCTIGIKRVESNG
ncbi:O-acyltransferase like protein-like [Uloborus diversus]|uniref:O-acyltransferase like protein-like n=1 Tax=Uloborus diversus TaxID=327109 RepID=UPI0024098133|nr:O-acyltransferase like protein-like [Uloborus diversus]